MARSLWVFNLFLAVLALALVWVLVELLADRRPLGSRQQAAGSRQGTGDSQQQTAAQAAEADAPPPHQASVPPLSDFDDILAKDAFKNPIAAVPKPPAPPPPPLPPLPSLLGTIFVGEERQAILSSNNRAEIFSVGQAVAGGTLVRIEADRVAIERGSTTSEILLKASLHQVPVEAAPSQVESGPAQPGVPGEARPAEAAPRPLPLRQGFRGVQPKPQPQQGVQPRQGIQFH